MMLKLYNTMSREKETFEPLVKREVGMYSCGPTAYNYAHIGNLRTFVFEDVLRSYLIFKGYKLKYVMNITDVDDKTIRDSTKAGIELKEFTEHYAQLFFQDCAKMNIKKPIFVCRATKHVGHMVELVEKLMKKGIAYKGTDGSIYYSISKFPKYGKLSHMKISGLKAGARVAADEYEKETASDFALWKAWTPEDGKVYWETPLGKGRPGWHIECSAMSMNYLGESFDIHCGGVDLIFPHHENEIAQSEAVTGKLLAKYWLHGEHLLADGKKMAKKLHNFYTLRDLLEHGYNPLALRYLYLSSHYRQQLNFTLTALDSAQNTLEKLQIFLDELQACAGKGNKSTKFSALVKQLLVGFEKSMDNDLDAPQVLAHLHEFVNSAYKLREKEEWLAGDCASAVEALKKIDAVFAVFNWKTKKIDKSLEKEVEKLIEEREKLRGEKKFSDADKVRAKLTKMGITLEDTSQGPKWRKA